MRSAEQIVQCRYIMFSFLALAAVLSLWGSLLMVAWMLHVCVGTCLGQRPDQLNRIGSRRKHRISLTLLYSGCSKTIILLFLTTLLSRALSIVAIVLALVEPTTSSVEGSNSRNNKKDLQFCAMLLPDMKQRTLKLLKYLELWHR